MRVSLLAFLLCLVTACAVFQGESKTEDTARPEPTGLTGPEYDPATSPTPMTQNTVLPRPADGQQPAAYGNQQTARGGADAGATQGTQSSGGGTPSPAAYGSAPAGTYAQAAPAAYAQQPPADPATEVENQMAATLTGLWVNQADPEEVVEFAPDHYTTFYAGRQLFREPLTFHGRCPGECNGGVEMEISCFTVTGPDHTDCFGIVRLSPNVLEMSLLGVSTETVVYHRQK